MAFNGSGQFVRLYSWSNDAANGIDISSTRMDAEDNGFATGLSTCLTKDGQQVPTANLPMGGFLHTGVGNATARTNYAAAGQVQDSAFTWCGTAGGTANAITLTPSPAITTYTAGQRFQFVSSAANTGATTVAVSGLAAKNITKFGTIALASGDIPNGARVEITFDGTQFQISTPIGALPLYSANNLSDVANTTTALNNILPSQASANGKVLSSNGTNASWTATSVPQLQSQIITATGAFTFTTPSTITTSTRFKVTLTAGGGTGGGGSSGCGGGGGETIVKYVTGLSPSTGYTGSVGAGGGAGSTGAGSAGSNTTFTDATPTTYTAHGGSGGGTSGVGAAGGSGGNGDLNIPGCQGGLGATSSSLDTGGEGGGTIWGSGAPSTMTNAATNGIGGIAYGTGGSGGSNSASSTGGAGKSGVAIFEWIA